MGDPNLILRPLDLVNMEAELRSAIPALQEQLRLLGDAKKVSQQTLRYEVTI